jgi:predicted TIM-barrel fold metal-dependent hydrolase
MKALADRCLYGSNFPIEKLRCDYATLYRTFRQAIADMSDEAQHAILYVTASRLYRIQRSVLAGRKGPFRPERRSRDQLQLSGHG